MINIRNHRFKRTQILKRYKEIVFILFKYGFKEIVNRIKIGYSKRFILNKISKHELKENLEKPFAIRIRLMLEELGPTFIKFGQMLSMRPDILPKNIIMELQRLQDQVPPFPFSEVKEAIKSQFNKPISEIFESFTEEPEAAASIAQCHRARTFDGEDVAVKIKRPLVKEIIIKDLCILFELSVIAEKYFPDLKMLNPKGVIEEFALSIQYELDFFKEGRNVEAFRKYFQNDPGIHIMKIYWELCTENILTMEYIDGIKASNLEELKKNNIDLKAVAINGANTFLKQVFELGFFHADPHSGNIFILKDSVIALIDFGMIGYIDDFLQKELIKALIAFVDRDPDGLIKVLRNLELVEDSKITRALHYDIKNLINYYYNISLSQLNLATVIFELIEIIRKHNIKMPVDLVLLAKAVSTIETLGKSLYPEFDMIEVSKPFVGKLMMSRMNPFNRLKDVTNLFQDSSMLLKNLPEELNFILKKIRKNQLKVNIEHSNLDFFVKEMDKSSNRLSFSILIASILVGSSLIINVDKGPYFFGIPLLGLAGYITAGIFGLLLLIGIIKSGRL